MPENIVYEEYHVSDGEGESLGYYYSYDEAVNILKANGYGRIYGAHWIPSEFKGLLHRVWSEVKI